MKFLKRNGIEKKREIHRIAKFKKGSFLILTIGWKDREIFQRRCKIKAFEMESEFK